MSRTKNRGNPETITAPADVFWKLGEYIRLSKEDVGRGKDESNSVTNQRRLLDDYYQQHRNEFEAGPERYIDDGCTGTDTNRKDFQRLLAHIYAKKVNCVIVKDLSRLSRNYTEAGSLIENLFVQMNVRFISLAEGVDSSQNPDSVSSILVPITNVINDQYCYQTSKKIRQVFDYKRRNGEHIGGFAVYGYSKDPGDRHSLVIDEEAADVVRSIYTQLLEGVSKSAIVRGLNERGVPCPSEYKKSKGSKYQNPHATNMPMWSLQTVTGILKNPMYAGDMVQGRQRVKSYKIHTQEKVPESEWYVVKNTHEPIIDRETFERVQGLLRRDVRTAPAQNAPYLFGGFLRCADCGKAMGRSKVKGFVYYFCRTYKDQLKTACTKHSLRHEKLEAAALYAVQQQVYLAVRYANAIEGLSALPLRKSQCIRVDARLQAKNKELAKVTRYKQSLYQDWKDGEISHKDYRRMKEDYEAQGLALGAVIDKLTAEREELKRGVTAEPPCLTAFKRFQSVEALTREMLIALVDYIKIHENGKVSVRFKFADEFRRIMEYIEINTHSEAV